MCDRTNWPDEAVLLADLNATFPGLWAKPVRELGSPEYSHGAWTGGSACMPDGFAIFCSTSPDPEVYNGRVHQAFEQWLDQRGWLIEEYDGGAFVIRCHAEDDEFLRSDMYLEDLYDQQREALLTLNRVGASISDEIARRLLMAGKQAEHDTVKEEAEKQREKVVNLRLRRQLFIGAPKDDPRKQPLEF